MLMMMMMIALSVVRVSIQRLSLAYKPSFTSIVGYTIPKLLTEKNITNSYLKVTFRAIEHTSEF